MQYDIIKDRFAITIDKFPILRKFFYLLLDLLLLRQWYVKSKINRYFKKDDKIRFYDAGAGFGQYSWYVLNRYKNANVHAADLKTEYMNSFAKYCSKDSHKNFSTQQADLVDYVPNDNFDAIIAVDILEHIEDDRKVLENFRQVIAKNGKLIISSPSNFDESAKFVAEHVRPGYSKEDICEKLETAGFIIESFDYSYGKFGHIYWLFALKFPLQMVGKSKLAMILLPFYYLIFYPISFFFMCLDFWKNNKIGTGVIVVATPK